MTLQENIKCYVFVIFVILICYEKSLGQTYFIRNYSIENGLPTSFIFDATQDLKGRMWFATATGISVYDGLQWNNYDKNNGLPNVGYRKIKTDEKGTIWCLPIYMCETLVCFVNDSIKTIALPEKETENNNINITSFDIYYENNNPVLCIGTYNGIYILKDGTWKNYKTNNGLMNNYVYSTTVHKNRFYIITQSGISIFDGVNFDNSLNEMFKSKYIDVIAVAFDNDRKDNEEKMWVLGKKWIGWIENNKLNILNESFLLPTGIGFEYPSLVPGKNNLIFFGNYYFAYYINKITRETFPITHKQGFKSDRSTSVFVDKEGNVWRTGPRGIDKLNSLSVVNYYASDGLQENEVTAIYEYSPGFLVLGHNNGLTLFKNGKYTKYNFPIHDNGYYGDSRVLEICKGKDGTIWFASFFGGLGKLDKNRKIKWIKFNNKNYVNSIAVDRNGTLYVALSDCIYIEKNGKFDLFPNLNLKKQFYRRLYLYDDVIIIASLNGFIWKKDNDVKYFTAKGNEAANNVYSIIRDKKNRVLIGTKDGLYILKKDTYEKFEENGFKIDRSIYSIIQDSSGNYWFGTDDGVIKWDGNNEERVFSKGNGLSGSEINRAALCNDIYGNIWIGTESGMTCYRPEFDKSPIPIPNVILLNTEDIEGNKYSLNQDVSLKSKVNSLYFKFRGISFYNENYIKYKIKLEGSDADWSEITQWHIDNIRYTNLVSGDYRLLVSAKNVSGEWSKLYSSSVITIKKPYFKEWWFILITITVLVSLFYFLYKIYLNRIYYLKLEHKVQQRTSELRETEKKLRTAQALLEKKVEERTEKLGVANEQLRELIASKDKFFSIIAHDLKSPFVGLLGYTELLKSEISTLSKEQILEYTKTLYKNIKNTYNLLENLLNWALLQTGRMAFNPEKLDLYLEIKSVIELFESHSKTKSVTLLNEIKINTYIEADKNMIRTIMYNLISNSIKFTKTGGQVIVLSRENNGDIEISVLDNGVGIPKENLDLLFKLDSNISTRGTAEEKGTGLGLMLCKEMIEKHQGKIFVESEIDKGTKFVVTLPVGNV
jgi:signal transduction histidine kinase/ligand-binding sensor domain-containing protein